MILLPEIRDQVHSTASHRTRPAGWSPSARHHWRNVVRPLAVATSILVVVVVTLVFTDVHHGGTINAVRQSGSGPPHEWAKLNAKAAATSERRDSKCRRQPISGRWSVREGPPGHDVTAVLSVLRNATPATDRVPLKRLRRATAGRLDQFARGIYVRYVRRGAMNGITYYLVPAANVNQVRAVPNRCYQEQQRTFDKLARGLRPAERSAVTRYEGSWLQAQRAAAHHPAGACLIRIGGGGTGIGPCLTVASLRQLRDSDGTGSDGSNQATVTALIVSNRVATVTAHYSPQAYPGRVPRPLTVTVPARQNVVIFYLHGAWDPPTSLVYRSANGSVLWSTAHR